jgi:hypothetical protein
MDQAATGDTDRGQVARAIMGEDVVGVADDPFGLNTLMNAPARYAASTHFGVQCQLLDLYSPGRMPKLASLLKRYWDMRPLCGHEVCLVLWECPQGLLVCRHQTPSYDATKLVWSADEALAMRRQALLDCAATLQPMCKVPWAKTAAVLVLDAVTKQPETWCEAQQADVQELAKFLRGLKAHAWKVCPGCDHMRLCPVAAVLPVMGTHWISLRLSEWECLTLAAMDTFWQEGLSLVYRHLLRRKPEGTLTPLKPRLSNGPGKQ